MHFLVPQIYPLPHIYQHPNNEKRRLITNRIHLPHLSFHARSRPQLPRLHPPTFDPTIQEKREKRKKEANYVPSNPHTHPKSPFILLLIPFSDPRTISHPITTAAVSTTVETPPRTRRSRPSFFSPRNIRGTARLNSTGSARVKRNWPRRRPFRGREASRFHAGRGYVVASWAARRILMRCPCCTRYT